MAVQWHAGADFGLAWTNGFAVIDGAVPAAVVESVWSAMGDRSDLAAFLDALAAATGAGLAAMPGFAVAVLIDGTGFLAARGDFDVIAAVPSGAEQIDGSVASSWLERRIDAIAGISLGRVGEMEGRVLSLDSGVVPAVRMHWGRTQPVRVAARVAARAPGSLSGSAGTAGNPSPPPYAGSAAGSADGAVPSGATPGPDSAATPPAAAPGGESGTDQVLVGTPGVAGSGSSAPGPAPSGQSAVPTGSGAPREPAAGQAAPGAEPAGGAIGERPEPGPRDGIDTVTFDPPSAEASGDDDHLFSERQAGRIEDAAVRERPVPAETLEPPRPAGPAPAAGRNGAARHTTGAGAAPPASARHASPGQAPTGGSPTRYPNGPAAPAFISHVPGRGGPPVYVTGPGARGRPPGQLPGSAGEGAGPANAATVAAAWCPVGHPNPPNRVRCRICDGAVGSEVRRIPQPSIGRMLTSTGDELELSGRIIIGRQPRGAFERGGEIPRVLVLPYAHISGSHLELRVEGWSLLAVDLESMNGTFLLREGSSPQRVPRTLTPLFRGDILDFGRVDQIGHVTLRFEDVP